LSDLIICDDIVDGNVPTILRELDQSDEHFFSEVAKLAADNWSDGYFGEITFTVGDPYMLVDNVRRRISLANQATLVLVNNVLLIPAETLIEEIGGSILIDDTQQSVTISIDEEVKYVDASPVILNDSIMLPSDIISDKLGFEIKWKPEAQQVTLTRDFQTKRVVLRSSAEVDLMNMGATTVVKGPDQIAVLQFATIQKAKDAYERLSELESIVWVEPDSYVALIE